VPTIRIALVLFFLGTTTSAIHADQGGVGRPSVGQLHKGTVEMGAIGGSTLPVSLFRARSNRRITMTSFDIGRVMTGQIGRAPLGGHFEMLLEMTPLFLVQQPELAVGLAVSPVFLRWNFAAPAGSRWRLFGEASGGILYTSESVPARTTSFNFIDQAGFGVRFEDTPRRAWLVGYRFQHISNGGRVKPNPGANFNFVYAGLSFVR
jgi:Lipid A 3-O-deacylase (PagL)